MVRGRDGMAILVATLLALALAIVAKDAHLFDGVEDQTVAMRFEARGAHTPSNVAVIAIDDVTFSDLERQWPFPRSLHGRAIDALRKAGARRIVYDVQFTEPTKEREDVALFNAIQRAGDVVLATTETDGRGGTNVLGGDENVRAAGAHAAAANLETDRGGVIHRFPRTSGGLRQRRGRGRRPRAPGEALRRQGRVDRLRRAARHGPHLQLQRPHRTAASTPPSCAAASSWSAPPPRRSRTSTPPRPPATA